MPVASDSPSPGACTFSGAWGSSVTLPHFEFDPLVVNPRIDDAVALKMKVPDGVDAASLTLSAGGSLALTPSGPGLFCVMLTRAQVLAGYQAGDPHNFVGLLSLLAASQERFRLDLFVNVLAEQVPLVNVERVFGDLQVTAHVANLHLPDQISQNRPIQTAPRRFYDAFPDAFDFVNIVSEPSFRGNTFVSDPLHLVVRNDVFGLGLPIKDRAATYGSAGRLSGLTHYSVSTFYDLAGPAYLHTLGHRWISYSNAPALRSALFAHWPLSSMAYGIMGYGFDVGESRRFDLRLTPAGGSGYRADAASPADTFNEVELYLMGLLPPASVPPQVILDDQSGPPCGGCTSSGRPFTVQELIASSGARTPAFPLAPTRFTVATLVVSMERLLTPREMSFFDNMAARGEATTPLPYLTRFERGTTKPFALATGNRASLSTTLGPRR